MIDVATMEALLMDGPLPADLCVWWEDFLAKEPGVGNHEFPKWQRLCLDHLFASGLAPLQRRREMEKMIAAAGSPTTVMSIGVDKGSDIYSWLVCCPSIKHFIACEIRGTPYSALLERRFPQVDFLWLPTSSLASATANGVRAWLGLRRIDAIFIDGDKSFFDVDFNIYRGLLAKDAVAFFHDIQDEAPGAAWMRVLAANPGLKCEQIIDTSEVGPALEKLPEKRTAYENWMAVWHGRSCGVGVLRMEGK